jgi:hypothetical protein
MSDILYCGNILEGNRKSVSTYTRPKTNQGTVLKKKRKGKKKQFSKQFYLLFSNIKLLSRFLYRTSLMHENLQNI